MDDELIGRQSAHDEARALYGMLLREESTVEEIRTLMEVPPRIERALRAFARAHAEDAHWIEAALKFREATLREFERQVAAGVSVADLSETEEAVSGVAGKTCVAVTA